MRWLLLASTLLAPALRAQNLAEPQYQLTGEDYRREAPAIQQMFYNAAAAVNTNKTDIKTIINTINQSTVAASVPILGAGSITSPLRLDSSSVTLQGNAFNGANQLLKTNASSQYPANGGSQITALNASNLASGTVPNARLDGTSVTLQGNPFHGVNLRSCGAVGDLTTDDAAAIQACVNQNKQVYVPPGNFRFNTAITISTDVMLVGDGMRASSLIKGAGVAGCGIIVTSSGTVLSDLGLIGASGNTGDGLCIRGRNVSISRIYVTGMTQDGLRAGCDTAGCNANQGRIEQSRFFNNGRFGINLDDNPTGLPDVNAWHLDSDFVTFSSSHGVRLGNAYDITLTNILADHNSGFGVDVGSQSVDVKIVSGDLNEADTLGAALFEAGAIKPSLGDNVNLPSTGITNFSDYPILQLNSKTYGVYGGTGGGRFAVDRSTTSGYMFEVFDHTDPCQTTGDFAVDALSHNLIFGRTSCTSGKSTTVDMYNRTGTHWGHWDTTGGNSSYMGFNSRKSVFFGFNDQGPNTTLSIGGDLQVGYGANKSTITETGDFIGATNSSVTLSGPNGFVQSSSSGNFASVFGWGGWLSGIPSTASISGQFTSVGASTQALAVAIGASTQTLYNVRASSGVNADLTALNNTLTMISTLTIKGNSFSVGGSTFVVSGGSAAIGTSSFVSSATLVVAGSVSVVRNLEVDGTVLGVSGATETVNASMTGVGTAASPLGVSPSSVAILNATGFVPNSEIDPSSVAKLSSGLIPNWLIDTSSITKLNSSGLVPNPLIDSSSVTKQGNTFNSANQLVKTDANNGISVASASFSGTGNGVYALTTSTGIHILNNGCITFGDNSQQCTAGGGGGSSSSSVSTVTLTWVQDNFLGQTNGSKTAFTFSGTPSSSSAVFVLLDGMTQGTSDYTIAGLTVTMTTAPLTACNSTVLTHCTKGFEARYTINTSTAPGVAVLSATQTFSGAITLKSTVTLTGVANWEWLVMSTRIYTNVASQSFNSNFSSFTLANYLQPYETDASSIPWHLKYNCYVSSTGGVSYAMVFNDDTTANYAETHSRVTSTGAGGIALSAGRWIPLQDYGVSLGAGGVTGDVYFETLVSTSSTVQFNASGSEPANINQLSMLLSGNYVGPSVLSSFALTTSLSNAATAQPDHKMSMQCLLYLLRGIGPNQIGNP